MNVPRLMIAAPGSGSGKTWLTLALLRCARDAGRNVASCKCGPDYIDPMFHRRVLGVDCANLDTFFTGEEETRRILSAFAQGKEGVLMEGVMGIFDGVGGVGPEGSSYHLAEVTGTPVVLVADVHGMGRSMIPLLRGFLEADEKRLIRGVILNRISPSFYAVMEPLLKKELRAPVLGYLPQDPAFSLPSRHLGLFLPEEIQDLEERIGRASAQIRKSVDLPALKEIAESAAALEKADEKSANAAGWGNADEKSAIVQKKAPLMLVVARDEAFCFYYRENLEALKRQGIVLRCFSPLHDDTLPKGAAGLLLGGGYPELYAEALSRNESMRRSIRGALENGLPSLAECGGFLYLHDALETRDKRSFPMAGVIRGRGYDCGRPVRFGYLQASARRPGLLLPPELAIRGHEFHYYESSNAGDALTAAAPASGRQNPFGHAGPSHLWGFPHFYYPSQPSFAARFAEAMAAYSGLACHEIGNI